MAKKIYLSNSASTQVPDGWSLITATAGSIVFSNAQKSEPMLYKYEIGQWVPLEGGVIFHRWIEESKQNYLVVDVNNITTSAIWSGVLSLIGTSSQNIYNGLSNSNAIVSQIGHTSSAAKLCLDSVNAGKNDWYLPSKAEFELLFQNYLDVEPGIISAGGQVFDQRNVAIYWTSNEAGATTARFFYVDQAYTSGSTKTNSYAVRAVRKFSI